MGDFHPDLLFHFFKLFGTYTAQGALVILGQLVTLKNIITNSANKLFHADSPFFAAQSLHFPTNVSWQVSIIPPVCVVTC